MEEEKTTIKKIITTIDDEKSYSIDVDMHLRAHLQFAAPGLVGLQQLAVPRQQAAGGEVRRGHDPHQLFGGDLRVVDLRDDRVHGLAQIVGRYVGGQADGDAAGAVHQQVGEARGQQVRLLHRVVEVQVKAHGVLVDVPQHGLGGGGHAGLGVTHGGRAVAVDGAEVAVAVHQHGAHHERLRHAGQRVVDGAVAVGMELAQRRTWVVFGFLNIVSQV